MRLYGFEGFYLLSNLLSEYFPNPGKYGVSGEVSSVCDDRAGNVFVHGCNRFPALKEDEPHRYYLCQEYPPAAPDTEDPHDSRA